MTRLKIINTHQNNREKKEDPMQFGMLYEMEDTSPVE